MPKKSDAEKDAGVDVEDLKHDHEPGEVPVTDEGQRTVPTTVEKQKEEEEGDEEVLVDPAGDDAALDYPDRKVKVISPRVAYHDPDFNPVAASVPPGHFGGPGAEEAGVADEGPEPAERNYQPATESPEDVDEDIKFGDETGEGR